MSVGSTVAWLTADELAAAARAAGRSAATARTIRHWRSRGLILAPKRLGRIWRYPPEARWQVETIARWRARGAPLEQVRFAVFVETRTIDADEGRAAALGIVRAWGEMLETVKSEVGGPESLAVQAARLAGSRGRRALPRRVRMSSRERTLAVSLILSRLVAPLEAGNAVGQVELERLFGLRSGRGGTERDLTRLVGVPLDAARVFDTRRLSEVVGLAHDDEMELARRTVELACLYLPLFTPVLAAAAGPSLAPFFDIAREMETSPVLYAVLFAIFLCGIARMPEPSLAEALDSFRPETVAVALLRAVEPMQARRIVARLEGLQRERVLGAVREELSG